MDKAKLTRLIQLISSICLVSACSTPATTPANNVQQTQENALVLIGKTKSGSLSWSVDLNSVKKDQQYVFANVIELSPTDSNHKIIDKTVTDCDKKLTSTQGPLKLRPPKGIEIDAVEVICRNALLIGN
jgi:hypothetical protein